MKRFLSMILCNSVLTGVAVWGLIYGNHAAETVAVYLLWIIALVNILAGIFLVGKDPYIGYEIKGFYHVAAGVLFDVANAILVINSGRPVLAIFTLVGASFSAYYISIMNRRCLEKSKLN